MELFTSVAGGHAILRAPKGVLKQSDVYRRHDRLYVKAQGGFVEIRYLDAHTGLHSTGHPDVKIVEFEVGEGQLYYVKEVGHESPRWAQSNRPIPPLSRTVR